MRASSRTAIGLLPALCVLCCLFHKGRAGGSCTFPEFMWWISTDQTQRVWLTEAKFLSSAHNWESRRRVIARETDIEFHVQYPWICPSSKTQSKKTSCIKTEMVYTWECVNKEREDKYRVRKETPHGLSHFLCIKLIRRNKNVVQLWTSKPSDTNDAELCRENTLTRDEWPWLAEQQEEWKPCPLVGGYDFRAYLNERKKKICPREWRPSRLESECQLGEGLRFYFPVKGCSLFHDKQLEKKLHCWAHWTEDWHVYIVMSELEDSPQYVMRLPKSLDADQMDVHFYFSPVCPIGDRGIPPGNVMYVVLRLKRSEPGVCFDESPECVVHAREGRCTNGYMHSHGNYCKRSCGLCELVPSRKPECGFPLGYQGEYLLFERDRKETVSVSGGVVTFSRLGSFICKGKHWREERYKFLSVYENGCRPRYTCMDFKHDETESFLRYRLSPSNLADRSFDLCVFRSDPHPISDRIRSPNFKILFPLSAARQQECGLGGLVQLRATYPNRQSCQGSLADWDAFSCGLNDKLLLDLRDCKRGARHASREFSCEAYVQLGSTHRLLFTREEIGLYEGENTAYQCWLINLHLSNDTGRGEVKKFLWKQAFILKRIHCGLDGDLDPAVYKPSEISFQIRIDSVEKRCVDDIIKHGSYSHSGQGNSKHRKTEMYEGYNAHQSCAYCPQGGTVISYIFIVILALFSQTSTRVFEVHQS